MATPANGLESSAALSVIPEWNDDDQRKLNQTLAKDKRNMIYTAPALREDRPDTYKAIIMLRAIGLGIMSTARALSVQIETVVNVLNVEPESAESFRKRATLLGRNAALLQLERLVNHPGKVPWNVSALVAKQMIESAELLDGRPTQRIEHSERLDIHAHFNDALDQLPSEADTVDAEIVEDTPIPPATADATPVEQQPAQPGTEAPTTDSPTMPVPSVKTIPASNPASRFTRFNRAHGNRAKRALQSSKAWVEKRSVAMTGSNQGARAT